MTLLVMIAAALPALPAAAAPTVAEAAARPACSPCAYSARNRRRAARLRRRAQHELELVRWYMRRHRATRRYRAWLASTRACESGGRYGTNTGNGFFGAYQFTVSSWRAAGGRGYPHLAPPLEQDYRAVRLLRLQGAGAWPVCG